MADREQIILELESDISRAEAVDNEWVDCIRVNTLRKAVELLKEQESHLLIEDDFVNADHYGYIPAWTEERNGDQFWKCVTRRSLNCDTKRMRYWSNKPTDEQREAVKWDDEA